MIGLKIYWTFQNIESFLVLIPFWIKLKMESRREMRELKRLCRVAVRMERRETIREIGNVIKDALDLCFEWLIRCMLSFFRILKRGLFGGFIKPILAFCGHFLLYFFLTSVIMYSFAAGSLPGLLFISSWFASIIILFILKSAFVWIPLGLYLFVVMYLTFGSLFSNDVINGKNREKRESESFTAESDSSYKSEYEHNESDKTRVSKHIFDGMDVLQARRTYRHLMKITHPDNGGNTEEAADITRQYQEFKKNIG